jgi:hypothetical protein
MDIWQSAIAKQKVTQKILSAKAERKSKSRMKAISYRKKGYAPLGERTLFHAAFRLASTSKHDVIIGLLFLKSVS